MDTVLLFAGGDSPNASLVDELPEADLVVAADSGYDVAVSHGLAVDVLVGDFDSIVTEVIPTDVVVHRHDPDKDATDLELALEVVSAESPERVVVVGGGGGRVDHELATAALLCSLRWETIEEIDWVTDRGWSHVVRGRRLLHGDVGATLSLVPMGGDARGVSTRGLRWELSGATLRHGTTLGVSNVFAAPVAEVTVERGCLLAVIPVSSLR